MITIKELTDLVINQAEYLKLKSLEDYEKIYDSITEDANEMNFTSKELIKYTGKIVPGMVYVSGQYFKYFVNDTQVIILNRFHK